MKVVFIWVPKVAGTSIWRYLKDHAGAVKLKYIPRVIERFDKYDYVTIAHLSHHELLKKKLIHNDTYKFCFVRNPWDRFVSLYEYFVRHNRIKTEFEPFCEWFKDNPPAPVGLYNSNRYSQWNNQVDWIPDDIDFIGRYESLQQDFEKVCEVINVRKGKLPVRNKSSRKNIVEYYSNKKTINIISKFYKKDIKRFGYEWEHNK